MVDYHLIGVGGIGMSALARLLVQRGQRVSGSDKSSSVTVEALRSEGVSIGPAGGWLAPETTVVRSSAVLDEDPELTSARKRGHKIWHRSDLLAELMRGSRGLTVAGTHGKTTTTALLAWVLQSAGWDPSFALGGLLEGVNGRHGSGDHFVAEADESDGSLVKYTSYGGILTGIEADHMDHYETEERLFDTFLQYIEKVERRDLFFWCGDDPRLADLAPEGRSYGFSAGCDLHIESWKQRGFSVSFTIGGRHFELPLVGRHNVLNGAAVCGLACALGVEIEQVQEAFSTFPGVERRCTVCGEVRSLLVVDDYAHHPTAVAATLEAVRRAARGRRVIACFQPHRYSRLSHCMELFAESLKGCDLLFVTEVYAAGEEPIPGVDADALCNLIGERAQRVMRAELVDQVVEVARPHDIVLMMGAGDITHAAGDLVEALKRNPPRKYQVAVLSGGASSEHEVSLVSGRCVAEQLSPDLYECGVFVVGRDGDLMASGLLDEIQKSEVVVPVFHGPQGEDGLYAALCEALGKAYVGCDYRSASLAMDKGMTKRIAMSHGIPTPRFIECRRGEQLEEVSLSFPVIVKPSHLGSSIGIERVERPEELSAAVERALALDTSAVVEEVVVGRELEFAVLGNGEVEVAAPGEILAEGKIYDYEGKYGAEPMATTPRADLSQELVASGCQLAKKTFTALGCEGLARIDFFLDEAEQWWLNEVNPLPGFTPLSLYPQMWESSGLSYSLLLDQLIILGLERARR